MNNTLIGVLESATLEVNATIIETGPRGIQGPPGTTNYNDLTNKPSIESVELIGNKTFDDLIETISNAEIDAFLNA